ncbi:MAG: TolC family outer membrane protein [Pseudomonadota bacterium]
MDCPARRALACAALVTASGAAQALSLVEAYEKARLHDPQYRAAYFASEGGKEYRVLGRAALLPSVAGSYAASRNRTDISSGTRFAQPVYSSHAASVSLRQSLFNVEALARYRQGQAQSKASAAQFDADAQALILRVVGAYFEAVFADDQVALALASRDMVAEQDKVNATLFKKGEGTRTDMLETGSRLALAEARLLEAKDGQLAARSALASLIGDEVDQLDTLGKGFQLRAADQAGFARWKEAAMAANPELKAQLYGVEAARAGLQQSRAGHLPRLDFVATYAKNDSETINTLNQDSTVRNVGVQMNVPIYSGGAVDAAARQAAANHERARAELEGRTGKVLLELRKDYDAIVSSVARIDALVKAVAAASLLIDATTHSIKGGVRINLDLLSAQEQLYTARRDLAQARYAYLLATLRLRAGAGALSSDDVREVGAHFR